MDLSERPERVAPRHPWEVERLSFFAWVIRSAVRARPVRVLDAGAGDGWFAARLLDGLAPGSVATCWDASYTDAELVTLPAAADRRMSFVREAPDEIFDLVLLLDVLEHVERDAAFLAEVVARGAPGALTMISVPAWPSLYGRHDVALRHYRRYAPERISALIGDAGLRVRRHGGLFPSLLPPRALTVLGERIRGRRRRPADWLGGESVGHELGWTRGAFATGVVRAALQVDSLVNRALLRIGIEVPGLSWWALCDRGYSRGS